MADKYNIEKYLNKFPVLLFFVTLGNAIFKRFMQDMKEIKEEKELELDKEVNDMQNVKTENSLMGAGAD